MAGTRPRDRKALIRSTAGELFLERGYHNVSVSDVAEALDIAPSALYHHYRNKQDLLLHAVLAAQENVDALVREATSLDDAIGALAAMVVGPRSVLAVWEREARNLETSQRRLIRQGEAEIIAHLTALLRADRPDLDDADSDLGARAVLGSRARHRLSLPRRKDEALMSRLAQAVARCQLPEAAGPPPPASTPLAGSMPSGLRLPRRDLLLTEAIKLFDERGYQSVTMADIGEAAGIVASGVYRHFSSKTDLLVAAVNRGGERLRGTVAEALATATDSRNALESLLGAHITVSVEHQHLMGVLANEADQLPDADRASLRRFQADYLDLWVQALRAVLLDERGPTELKIVVHAVQSLVYYVVRTEPREGNPGLHRRLTDLGMATLLEAERPIRIPD